MLTPQSLYEKDLQNKVLQPDEYQAQAVEVLERLFRNVLEYGTTNTNGGLIKGVGSFWAKVSGRRIREQQSGQLGCYLWGGVGRGKTHLMDYFVESLPDRIRVYRTHFHRFMRDIHQQLRQIEGQRDPLDKVAAGYVERYQVICLDEFVVIDITDAMLLAGLLSVFFKKGLFLVTTSNVHPTHLYKDGLQRARFLPAISLIQQHLEVFHLDSPTDFRLRHLKHFPIYIVLKTLTSDIRRDPLWPVFLEHSAQHEPISGQLEVNHRLIQHRGLHGHLIWFDFFDICGEQRAVADYIDIAKEFRTVLISNIPQLGAHYDDATRRFVHLVDEFYEVKVKLILSAEVPLEALYTGRRLEFEFERTKSRLIEMQSEDYLSIAVNVVSRH